MARLLRVIIPTPANRFDYATAHGTKVVTPNGEIVHGVTKLVLIAELDNVWHAEIHCFVAPPDLSCLSTMNYRAFVPPLWRRVWNYLIYGYRIKLP